MELLENYLASQYTFGFELEGYKRQKGIGNLETRQGLKIIADDISQAFGVPVTLMKDLKLDGSLGHDYEPNVRSFEWASPPLPFTPTNISYVIKGIGNLRKKGYFTDSKCGFHTHLSFPDISSEDCIWIMTQLAFDEKMIDKLSWLDNEMMFSYKWANPEYLKQIRQAVISNDAHTLSQLYTTEKYRLLRIHPQGTLEWRGPRGFMEKGRDLHHFFKVLTEFVLWMSRAIVAKSVNGINRDTFFRMFFNKEALDSGTLIKGFKENQASDSLKQKFYDIFTKEDGKRIANIFLNHKDLTRLGLLSYQITEYVCDTYYHDNGEDEKTTELLEHIQETLCIFVSTYLENVKNDRYEYFEPFFEMLQNLPGAIVKELATTIDYKHYLKLFELMYIDNTNVHKGQTEIIIKNLIYGGEVAIKNITKAVQAFIKRYEKTKYHDVCDLMDVIGNNGWKQTMDICTGLNIDFSKYREEIINRLCASMRRAFLFKATDLDVEEPEVLKSLTKLCNLFDKMFETVAFYIKLKELLKNESARDEIIHELKVELMNDYKEHDHDTAEYKFHYAFIYYLEKYLS